MVDVIKTVCQDRSSPNSTWKVVGNLVKPQDIQKIALLTVKGKLDNISRNGQIRSAYAFCLRIPKNNKSHYEVISAGHYDIFSDYHLLKKVYSKIKFFIRQCQGVPKENKG